MSKTAKKYIVRDRSNRYKEIDQLKLEDKYYTDSAKSHDRKIRKKGLKPEEYSGEDESR